MGRFRDELTDPWGLLLAGVVGGVATAFAPVTAAVAIGVAVYGVKVAAGSVTRTSPEPQPQPEGVSAAWIDRAVAAVSDLRELAQGAGSTPTDQASAQVAVDADAVVATMRRLGGQSAAVAEALRRVDRAGLEDEETRARLHAQSYPTDESAQSSAAALADRLAVRDRLRAAQATLEGRLQASALGLEGLVARVAELRATASSAGEVDPTSEDLAELARRVEGLRLGITEAEEITRSALRGAG